MHTLWHKVWADLRLNKSRCFLAVCSIAAGVFCVGTLFGMIDLQLAQMDAAHQRSQPSHITLILRQDADVSLLAKIKTLPGVAAVDAMTPLSVRFKRPGDDDWIIGTLILRSEPDRQRFDRSSMVAGDWPGPDQVAVENLSAQAGGFTIGGDIELETPRGSRIFNISGVVRHPFVKPPKFGGQVHFFADTDNAGSFGRVDNRFRQLLVRIKQPYSADKAREVAAELRQFLVDRGLAVNVTLLQDPDKHWGRPFMAGVNGVLQIMALASLLLASVLIFNTMAAHITQQIDQIGVMKALGAKNRSIAGIYISETLLLALVAIFLATLPALVVAHVSSCQLLALFNIDCGGFSYSSKALLWMLLGGLLAPLVAVLLPVWRGATLNVRSAMASYGLGGAFGNNRFDLWLERLSARHLPTLYAAALGNLFRRKGRFVLTQVGLIVAGVMFLVLMTLAASLNLTLDNEMARSRFAVRLAFSVDQNAAEVKGIAQTLAGTEKAEVWQRLPLALTKNGNMLRQKGSLGTQLLALPVAADLYRPLIESGRWMVGADAGKRVLVISADMAALNGIRVGDFLDAGIGAAPQSWQVIGTYRWLAGSNYAIEPVYAPLQTVQAIRQGKDWASYLLLAAPTVNLEEEASYLAKLKQVFQAHGIELEAYNTVAKLEQRQFARNQFRPVLATLLGLAALVAVVAGIGLSGALAIGVQQRVREIGILRAIGASGQAVFRLFLLEGLLHGILAWLFCLPLAYLAAEPVARQLGLTMLGMQLDFKFDALALMEWLVIVMSLAWLAAYWPSRRAAQLTVAQSLAHA